MKASPENGRAPAGGTGAAQIERRGHDARKDYTTAPIERTPYLARLLAPLSDSARFFLLSALRRAVRAGARQSWNLIYAARLLLRDDHHREPHPDRLAADAALDADGAILAACEVLREFAARRRAWR